MSWLIAGTLPWPDFPVTETVGKLHGDHLLLGTTQIPVNRGTPALAAAAVLTARNLGYKALRVLLAGDIGKGDGSRRLYAHLLEGLDESDLNGITFHYLQPDVVWHNRILWKIQALAHPPLLVADAGYMYVAKMSGFAADYDLFTPDAGEMAFLADDKAPHPFYTRGFLLQEDNRIPDLITKAWQDGNSSQHLLVKGQTDHIACRGEILETIDYPSIETLEPIGGTGDTVTGIATGLLAAGYAIPEACVLAARINRVMGQMARPTPATSVAELLRFLPEALGEVLIKQAVH